jgi:hypothetical protein
MLRQGSRSSFVCDRWCCTREATTKGLTGILHVCNLSKRCVGAGKSAGADFREERRRLRERDSGESFFRGGGLTADTRRVRGLTPSSVRGFWVTGSMDWRGTTLECSSPATFANCCP